ncbi:MAG: RNA-binding S4 domain-containing protein [Nanoarchaeota archaeon]
MKYIELNTFLKITGLCSSGGEAKTLIRGEQIKVNEKTETQLRKKLVAGDIVTYQGQEVEVTEEVCQMLK